MDASWFPARYKLSSELADKGVLGTFAATDSKSGKKVVLKALDERSCDPALKLAFLRSHGQLKKTDLPFVPAVGPIEKRGSVLFFESEFVPGLPFGKAVRGRRSFRPKLLATLFSALSDLHSSGAFHGNLKPNNVLYDADEGKLALLDLGFWGYGQRGPREPSDHTYCAPELRRTCLADVRSDFYGFGLLAFELLTSLEVTEEVLSELCSSDRASATEWLASLSKGLDAQILDLIVKATSPQTSARPQSCKELLTLLRPILGEKRTQSLHAPRDSNFALCPEFVGRSEVLKRLHASMEDIRRRGVGATEVVGVTGSGKSRVMEEFLFECEEKGYRVARSSCSLSELNPYCNVLQLLETAAAHLDKDRSQSLMALASEVRADLLKLLNRPARRSLRLCGVNLPAGAESLRRNVLQALMELTRDEFWVFALDDGHSILGPAASLLSELIRQLAEKARKKARPNGGLFVVLTAPDMGEQDPSPKGPDVRLHRRPLAAIDALGSKAAIKKLNLNELEKEPASRLVESIVGSKKSARDLSSSLYDRFGGNPAWLAAGARWACSKKGVSTPVDKGSAGHFEALNEEEIPDVASLAKSMMSALDDDSKELLEATAVLPGNRELGLLEAVCDADDQVMVHRIDELCRKGILVWRHAGSFMFVDFNHDLFRQACRGSVSDKRAQEVHQRAVKYWERSSSQEGLKVRSQLHLNYHTAKSNGDQSSLEFLESLSTAFQSGGCYFRAAELLEDAIDLFGADTLSLSDSGRHTHGMELYSRRGDLNLLLSDYKRALDDYAKSISFAQAAKSIPDQCDCALKIAEVHRLKGELKEALEVLGEARSMAAAHEDVHNKARAAHAIGKVHWHQGKLNDALRSFNTALECAEEMEDEVERGAILHNIGSVFWAQGDYERAREGFIEAKEICEKTGEEHMRAVTLNSVGSTYAEQSEMTPAIECFSEALSAFRRLGDRRNMSTSLQNVASCLFWMGDIGPSLEKIEEAVSIKNIIGDIGGRSAALITRGEILREMGDYDGALRSHYEAFQTLMSEKEPFILDTAALQIALDHLEFGAFESASLSFERLLSHKGETALSIAVPATLGLARAHLEVGDEDKAVNLCNEALLLLEGVRSPISKALCLLTLSRAHTRGGRLEDAGDCLRRASSIVEGLRSPFPQFQLYWALGDYHLKANNLSESYTSYAQAASTLETIRAALPESKRVLFAKKRSLARFRKRWDAMKRDRSEDAARKAEPEEAWLGDDVAPGPVASGTSLEGPGVELIEACDIIISHLLNATPFDRGCISIRTDSGRLGLTRGMDSRGQVLDSHQLDGPASVSRHVNLTGTPVLTHRGAGKPEWLLDWDFNGSIMCVPLCGKSERLGTIYLDSAELLEMPDDRPLLAVQSLARLAAKLVEGAVLREGQGAYIRELVDRTKLLAGGRGVPPMLVPGAAFTSKRASAFPEIIGASEPLLEVTQKAAKIAKTDVTVLITGETGTGKELLAQAIHERSLRRDAPILVINCGAIPRDLVEAELFGFERGAFTGAHKQKRGRLEHGDKSTIFLDEVAELSLEMQVKLLRFLETKTIERVGGAGQIAIDCRIIAATNRKLEAAVEDGSFREDLYYRLSVIHLELPPIRDRDDDILRLANHFLSLAKKKYNKRRKVFSVKAVEGMMHHRWSGNVRELQNKVEKAILISSGSTITNIDLGLIQKEESQVARLKEVKDGVEASRLKTSLKASGGNVALAARMAGLSRQNFYRLLKKHALSLEEYRSQSDK